LEETLSRRRKLVNRYWVLSYCEVLCIYEYKNKSSREIYTLMFKSSTNPTLLSQSGGVFVIEWSVDVLCPVANEIS